MNISISKNFYDISIIPKNWTEKRLKNILSISENKSSNFNNEKILSLTKKGIVINDITSNKGQIAESYEKYIKVKKGQICMNPMDLLSGWVDISNFEGLISPAYYTFELNKEVENKFINYFLQSNYLRKTFFKLGKGVASHDNFGRWVLTPEELKNICLFIPNIDEQKLISCYLDKKTTQIDSLINKIEKKIELLKEQKTSLINQYVTKGLDPNVKMKDSGVEWIGEIPKHWKLGKLKYLSTLITKGTTPSNIGEDYDDSGEVRYLKGEDLLDGRVIDSGKTFISSEVNEKLRRSQLAEGDLLVVIAGTLGKCAVVPESVLPANTNQAISLIRFREGVNSDFIRYWFETSSCKNQISEFAVVAAQPNLSMEDLGNIIVPVITTDEQNEIEKLVTEKTTNINERILREVKRIDLLQEYRQSLISSTVTGKVRVTERML